jgi:hypothetical protein
MLGVSAPAAAVVRLDGAIVGVTVTTDLNGTRSAGVAVVVILGRQGGVHRAGGMPRRLLARGRRSGVAWLAGAHLGCMAGTAHRLRGGRRQMPPAPSAAAGVPKGLHPSQKLRTPRW